MITVLIIIRDNIPATDGTPNYSVFFNLLLLSVTIGNCLLNRWNYVIYTHSAQETETLSLTIPSPGPRQTTVKFRSLEENPHSSE